MDQRLALEGHESELDLLATAGIADLRMQAGRYREARELTQDILAIYPQHSMARRNLCQAELKLGDEGSPQSAVRHARILVKADPASPVLRILLSQTLIALGVRTGQAQFFDEAVDSALHCLEIAEPKGLVYITAAHARVEQGDLDAGIQLVDQSVRRGLDHWSVLIYRAELLARAGRMQDAARDLHRAQAKDPFAPQVLQAVQRFRAGRLHGAPPGK